MFRPATLGDFVWNDLNNDGIQDAGEPGLRGVAVELLDGNMDPLGVSTQTDADGMYLFDGLVPGTYSVQFILPDGFAFTGLKQGEDPARDSDADPAMDGMTDPTTLASGESDLTLDAGLVSLEPAIDIEKATNGVDADDPNGGDAPQLSPGDPVRWTYVV